MTPRVKSRVREEGTTSLFECRSHPSITVCEEKW
jgi:hypothetical protein